MQYINNIVVNCVLGIEPSCQWYRAKDWLYSYAYLIDPDGPIPDQASNRQIANNVDPFPVHCEFSMDTVLGITTLHYRRTLSKVSDY